MKKKNTDQTFNLFTEDEQDPVQLTPEPVTCLGMTFSSDEERREYFRAELRRKLPELRQIEGFPIGEDDDIIALSDPPYYTACPNPWLNDLIAEWEQEKTQLEAEGKRTKDFSVWEPYAEKVTEGKNSAIYNAHTYHTKVPYQIIMRYILHYTQPGDIVLDNFAGTGMTGVAASACRFINFDIDNEITNRSLETVKGSRHFICGDLSPLCFHISSNYNRSTDTNRLEKIINDIITDLKENYGYLYEYKTHNGIGHINYFVWSEIVGCKNCGESLVVHDLSYNYATKEVSKDLICPKCGTKQKRTEAEQIKESIIDINGNLKSITKYEQCLLNYSLNGRYFTKDKNNAQLKDFVGFVPRNNIKFGDKFSDPVRVGCDEITLFYPKRTMYVLGYLYNLIHTKYSLFSKELMFIFTSMLPKLTKMNRYMPQHGSRALVGPMANTLYIPPQFVENNPIDQFEYQAKKVVKALSECSGGGCVHVCSASESPIEANSVDYIFTDPPFGANIMYSELNYITESWLKLFTNNKDEAIANKSQHKGIFEYQNIMSNCMKEYYRVLKPGHWMTVEFSNTSAAYWNCLQNSLQSAGFIIASVADLNKERGGLHSMLGPTAVKQDLAITCFKPSDKMRSRLEEKGATQQSAQDFIEELLIHLPVHVEKDNSTTSIVERSAKILYDRLISYYVQHGYTIPMDAREFQQMLHDSFIERDGMFFTASQAVEYEEKRAHTTEFVPMALFISSEAEGIEWLKRHLSKKPQTYQELQPEWMKDMAAPKKGDIIPELRDILEENFIEESDGTWRNPDAEKAADLEILRNRRMMKEFTAYMEQTAKPKAKRMKDCRLAVLQYGFKECYRQKRFADIVAVGDHIPESLLTEDEVLLQYYDIALTRI